MFSVSDIYHYVHTKYMLFGKKQEQPSIKDVIQRIESLENALSKQRSELIDCLSQVETIRNKVLRRFQAGKNDLPDEKTPESINTFNPFGLS